MSCRPQVLERDRPGRWSIEYFGSTAVFEWAEDGSGGTDLAPSMRGVPEVERAEPMAGRLNVLLPLKAAVDFGVDLRSRDPTRTWDQRNVDR